MKLAIFYKITNVFLAPLPVRNAPVLLFVLSASWDSKLIQLLANALQHFLNAFIIPMESLARLALLAFTYQTFLVLLVKL